MGLGLTDRARATQVAATQALGMGAFDAGPLGVSERERLRVFAHPCGAEGFLVRLRMQRQGAS